MLRFHHVNLGVPVGGVEREAEFLVGVLGYRRLEAPAEFPTARWYGAPDGSEVHLSEDPDHRPAARAHVAVEVGDALDGLAEAAERSGIDYEVMEGAGLRVLFCRDPAGNRWELRGPRPA